MSSVDATQPTATASTELDQAPVFAAGPKHWAETTWARVGVPVLIGILFIGLWEGLVHALGIRRFVLPPPSMIAVALVEHFGSLMASLWYTLKVTFMAFSLALVGGVALAIVFVQSRVIELALFPYAVILQVTPVVAIAPIVLIWTGLDNVYLALLILAWIVAFFPILSNMVLGLRSADHNLINLFQLYGASRWQILRRLQIPSSLPYLLGGMKISGGLALIGAVVAEFVSFSGGESGIAWRIIESGNRLETERMFAALFLLSAAGVCIFMVLHGLQHLALRKWHESALRREN